MLNWIVSRLGNVFAGVIAPHIPEIVAAIILFVVALFVVPWLKQNARLLVIARRVLAAADKATDELRKRYPDNEWVISSDELIDSIIDMLRNGEGLELAREVSLQKNASPKAKHRNILARIFKKSK